jgi:hypothetical protein
MDLKVDPNTKEHKMNKNDPHEVVYEIADPASFLDDILGNLFRPPRKPKRKADPDYGKFRRLCKKHGLTYTVADDGYVDIDAPDGASFSIGENWDQRLIRLEMIIATGFDSGHGRVAWPAKVEASEEQEL